MWAGNHEAMKLKAIYDDCRGEIQSIHDRHPEIRQTSVALDEKTGEPTLVFIIDENQEGKTDISDIPAQVRGIDTKVMYSSKPIVRMAGHDPRP